MGYLLASMHARGTSWTSSGCSLLLSAIDWFLMCIKAQETMCSGETWEKLMPAKCSRPQQPQQSPQHQPTHLMKSLARREFKSQKGDVNLTSAALIVSCSSALPFMLKGVQPLSIR